MNKVLVIGGGIHGVTAALALSRQGFEVELVERTGYLLSGTSGATHNRAHRGYHYPRCLETAYECARGLEYFEKYYGASLHAPRESYYVIERFDSRSTTDGFMKFCDEVSIPYELEWPDESILDRSHIEGSFRVPESNFNLPALRLILLRELDEQAITLHLNTEIIGGEKTGADRFLVRARNGETFRPNIVVNASYAFTNNILTMFGVKESLTRYRLQHTEVVVAETPGPLPALTVMDGPFVSVMPYAGFTNKVLVYDVVHSLNKEEEGYEFTADTRLQTHWREMVEHGEIYYPFMRELTFVKSFFGQRPIPVDEKVDGRKTRLTTHASVPGLYSIQEGKFISAPLVAQALTQQIVADWQ